MIKGINHINPAHSSNKEVTDKNIPVNNDFVSKKDNNYDRIEINKLIDDNTKRINDFKETIRKMIVKQGEESNLTLFGKKLFVTAEDSESAVKAISDGGEYSVDAVATRIMDMAKALSNGDKSKIAVLKDAVIKGFEAAGLEFNNGGGLPDICNKTYDEIMKRFDLWENE